MPQYRLGLDFGSTTVKAVLLDENGLIIYSRYRRHRADIRGELTALFDDIAAVHGGLSAKLCVTGSAGLGAARSMALPFVQEVLAGTLAVRSLCPGADCVIELGGEDAKITFLSEPVTQRMNGTCAGGTGAFIDQMAALLQTDAEGLDRLARKHKTLYPIASRCGVFAKSDLQPLINEGVPHEDLAASVFSAVVNQTIAGLACGQPITGNVVYLGGPLHYLPQLRAAFTLALSRDGQAGSCFCPENAELFVAIGAAMSAERELKLSELPVILAKAGPFDEDIPRLEPLFKNTAELDAFKKRHAKTVCPRGALEKASGPCWLGVDAGSTTLKAVLIDGSGTMLYSHYDSNKGSPVVMARTMLEDLYAKMPDSAYIAGVCTTGYGEELLKTAMCADIGEIETLAHAKAAARFAPDVSFILDIGGQDMKSMRIKDGAVDSILINEACSSGCGSFLSTYSESLGLTAAQFGEVALSALKPVDLGTRCTVFMNSRVKQAQKEGAEVSEIAAGLAYSVVRNALFKVIKLKRAEDMGSRVLVQGGTFLSDAVLRAFELCAGCEAVRPDIAGLMGAYGAALIARERLPSHVSTLLTADRIDEMLPLSVKTAFCGKCSNRCKLTVNSFSGGRRLITGNRCENGARTENTLSSNGTAAINLFQAKYERLFNYTPLPDEKARDVIGIPRALNMYENYPFWFTVLTELGFSVVISARSDHKLFEAGCATIPSESVCYPAKLVHGHIFDLVSRGIKTIFYPCVPYERKEDENANNHFNCPIVTSYPEVIGTNVDILNARGVKLLKPFVSLEHKRRLREKLAELFASWGVTRTEVNRAVEKGYAEQDAFKADIRRMGEEAVARLERENGFGVVLAGRPYHCDPEIHHGIPSLLNGLGAAVLTEDSVAHLGKAARPLRVVDQWTYHTRLYNAAAFVAKTKSLEFVQLTSFGCGLDAVTADQAAELLHAAGRMYTLLKIDEIDNLGAAKIRLRSMKAAALERRGRTGGAQGEYRHERVIFDKAMKKRHTILAPQMSPIHFKLLEKVFIRAGYNMVILPSLSRGDMELGLRYVNNDACYPTIMVVGQLLGALLSGKYDINNTSVFITQTGGGCRATNYIALLRRALKEAGLGQVPVAGLSVSGIEKNPGLQFTPGTVANAVKALFLGDLLQMTLLRTRPYECEPGDALRLYSLWSERCESYIAGTDTTYSYKALVDGIIKDFDTMPLRDTGRKKRIGLVGEILVKFHPDANNNAVGVIESEGCEAVVPGLMGFIYYCFLNNVIKHKELGTPLVSALAMDTAIRLLHGYERHMIKALKGSERFTPPEDIRKLAELSESVLSTCNQCGEGWLLTAEMIELLESGAGGIICVQPFACLPNHVTGKGMIRALKRLYPHANVVPIDYDPGASEVNQLNRIKLMLQTENR